MPRVLLLKPDADWSRLRAALARRGATGTLMEGHGRRAVVVSGLRDGSDLPGVDAILEAESPHPRADGAPRVLDLGGVALGGPETVLLAGPCAAEEADTLDATAAAVAAAGARVLRGGAFKPRSSPYSFQGLGLPGLRLLRDTADRHGLRLVTEALDTADVGAVAEHADLIQIGSRSMQHFPLLRAAGRTGKPVLLKRGASATVEEWLLAAEYLLDAGAAGVALCERGLRTFEQPTRYTLDLGIVAWLLEHTPLPVVVDPSHAAGTRVLVPRLARAAVAAGAHGLLIEVHADAGRARCDAAQALDPDTFGTLAREILRGQALNLEFASGFRP
jgi:3-deoxy-7-phosphoheptulonate synthase